jgi:hypothetical protein
LARYAIILRAVSFLLAFLRYALILFRSTSASILICDCSAGAIIVSLLSATNAGKIFYIVKADDSANPVTVTRFGADDIEGSASVVLSNKYDKVILIANGTSSWLNLGKGAV